MNKIGIICEYNPFHNGHIYHINKIKEMFPNDIIILVMSSCFTERGEISLLNKWDKTQIAINHGVDFVVELPTYFATNSADIFAEGAIKILNYLKVNYLVFGSEINDIEVLNKLTDTQLNNKKYDYLVKKYMDEGNNYPTSMSKALKDLCQKTVSLPNDLLGLSYLKQIKLQHTKIIPVTIARTNDYHSVTLNDNIASATSIRLHFENNEDISNYVPHDTLESLPQNNNYKTTFFFLLKYKLISELDSLNKYFDITEGIDKRIKKYIFQSNSYQELIDNIKSKRYTYNRLNRMFIHIFLSLDTQKRDYLHHIDYLKVLGFSALGKQYIKEIKKNINVPIITNYSELNHKSLDYELQVSILYNLIMDNKLGYLQELKSIPIQDK